MEAQVDGWRLALNRTEVDEGCRHKYSASSKERKRLSWTSIPTGKLRPDIRGYNARRTQTTYFKNGGRRDGANTVIEFKRKLDTGDRFDKSMHPGETVSLIWAMADSSEQGVKHNIAYGEGIIPLIQEKATTISAAVPSPREIQGILFIWQEEKAARDLYISLYDETNLSIFMDLVRSEQNHMDQAKSMIDKFGLQTPVPDMPGELENQTLKEIYNRLQAQGKLSHQEALKSAATFVGDKHHGS